jgi:hypothetical protein
MKNKRLENHIGEMITLNGTAKNSKGNSVLITDSKRVIYIKDLMEWPEELLDTHISVKGTLEKIKLIPDPKIEPNGAISQGAEGMQYVLTNYELIES